VALEAQEEMEQQMLADLGDQAQDLTLLGQRQQEQVLAVTTEAAAEALEPLEEELEEQAVGAE